VGVQGWTWFRVVEYAADGKGLYVASWSPYKGVTMLYVNLQGKAHVLWQQKSGYVTWGVPSPDGRHLALLGSTIDSNAWMVENF
jgi:hypothetical protein